MYFRLKKNGDFTKLFSKGKKSYSSGLIMLYSKSKTLRMGISVSKKFGGSVQRNHIKRLIREAFRNILKENNLSATNIVFIPRPDYEHTYEGVKNNIFSMLKKEGLINC